MGLNLDIENFEPSSDTKFQDLIDWLNESFQKINSSPIMLEYRDEEGNLIWDEDNPVYESDVITKNFEFASGASVVIKEEEVSFDEIGAKVINSKESQIKINVGYICTDYQNGNNEYLSWLGECSVELYDKLTGTILLNKKQTYENGVIGDYGISTKRHLSFVIDYNMLTDNALNKIDLAVRVTHSWSETTSNSYKTTFNILTDLTIIKPQIYYSYNRHTSN